MIGDTLLGYYHTHPSRASSPLERSAPSGSDLMYLGEHLANNFVAIIDCGNVRYALVVEDVSKATTFINALNRLTIDNQLITNAQAVPTWFSNWQGATQTALKNLLGAASSSGIGFYKATNANKTNFEKLNP